MKINNQRELGNIAINHSADIDYNDFMKINREYTKELCFFFGNWYYATGKWSFKIKNLLLSYKNNRNVSN